MRHLTLLLALAVAACATSPAIDPPTQLPEVRPGYVAGYLQPAELPDSLALLLRRVRMDASRANDRAKNRYHRLRPFMVTNEAPCSKDESSPNSYPSENRERAPRRQ